MRLFRTIEALVLPGGGEIPDFSAMDSGIEQSVGFASASNRGLELLSAELGIFLSF
jgi:hypothetical protein